MVGGLRGTGGEAQRAETEPEHVSKATVKGDEAGQTTWADGGEGLFAWLDASRVRARRASDERSTSSFETQLSFSRWPRRSVREEKTPTRPVWTGTGAVEAEEKTDTTRGGGEEEDSPAVKWSRRLWKLLNADRRPNVGPGRDDGGEGETAGQISASRVLEGGQTETGHEEEVAAEKVETAADARLTEGEAEAKVGNDEEEVGAGGEGGRSEDG